MKEFIKNTLLGMIFGIAAVCPGLSGGVIAASLGYYEKLIMAVTGLKKNFRYNLFFLMPFALGGVAGVILLGKVILKCLDSAYFEIMYVFFGLILGTIPSLVSEANKKGYKSIYPLVTVFLFVLCVYSGSFVNNMGKTVSGNFFICYFVIGIIYSLGTVIPGLSSSFILMKAGLYEQYIISVSEVDIKSLILIAFGFILTTVIIIKLVQTIFLKAHGIACYAVLGLLLGSVVFNFPGIREIKNAIVDFSLLYLSFILSFIISMRIRRRA